MPEPLPLPPAPAAAATALVTVVGMNGDRFDLLGPEGRAALHRAAVVAGGRRHLAGWRTWVGETGAAHVEALTIGGDVEGVVRTIRQHAVEVGRPVCVLASGDPGFFGIVRALTRVVDRRDLAVLPAPSSVSVAFARLGLPWDDAVVVSAHGRPLHAAAAVARTAPKVAVLTSPDAPPEALGRLLADAGVELDLVAVCSRLGTVDEEVREVSVAELATGPFDPLSVVVLVGPGGLPIVGWSPGRPLGADHSARSLAWGMPESSFARRAGMITKSEVRAVVLSKLALPPSGVVWDIGAGSGSVAIECALLRPGLTVLAVEQDADDAARLSDNARSLGAGVHLVTGAAPAALDALPDPDRAFVGGGGVDVLRHVVGRLAPAGRVVATFAALDRAAAAAELLGNLVQVGIDHGERLPDGGWRLSARNPVFVAWGPGEEGAATGSADGAR